MKKNHSLRKIFKLYKDFYLKKLSPYAIDISNLNNFNNGALADQKKKLYEFNSIKRRLSDKPFVDYYTKKINDSNQSKTDEVKYKNLLMFPTCYPVFKNEAIELQLIDYNYFETKDEELKSELKNYLKKESNNTNSYKRLKELGNKNNFSPFLKKKRYEDITYKSLINKYLTIYNSEKIDEIEKLIPKNFEVINSNNNEIMQENLFDDQNCLFNNDLPSHCSMIKHHHTVNNINKLQQNNFYSIPNQVHLNTFDNYDNKSEYTNRIKNSNIIKPLHAQLEDSAFFEGKFNSYNMNVLNSNNKSEFFKINNCNSTIKSTDSFKSRNFK